MVRHGMEAEMKKALRRFILNNLGQMGQEEIDAWLDEEFDLTPLLEPALRRFPSQRDLVLAEMHQMSPPEIFDRLRMEHPELVFKDKERVIVRIGAELEAMKAVLRSL